MRGQDIDHDIALLGEEVGEGEAVVPGELEPHEHPLGSDTGKQPRKCASAASNLLRLTTTL